MTTPQKPTALSAEERARKTGPCWGDGLVAPKECDESYLCELHGRFAEAIREAEEAVDEKANKKYEADLCRIFDAGVSKAKAEGHREGLNKAAKLLETSHKSPKCVDPNDCPYCCFAKAVRKLALLPEKKA